jgi:hypothetical protein
VTTYIVIEAKLDPAQLEGKFSDRKDEIQVSLAESLEDWGFELQEMRVVGDGSE